METIAVDPKEFEVLQTGAKIANGLMSMEELIKNHKKGIDDLKFELKNAREMLEDSFNNNPGFHDAAEKAKEASREKSRQKAMIRQAQDIAILEQKVKDIRFDLNERKKTLSDLLLDWQHQSGATQLSLFDGDYELVQSVRLVKKARA